MVAAVALLAGMGSAYAQSDRGVPVNERPRPDYDALGVRAGAFLVKPTLTVGALYDDNIFAQRNNTDSDFVWIVTPAVAMESDWNVHYLRFRTAAELGRFSDFTRENYNDYNVGADARLDVTRGAAFNATVDYRREHEDRGSPNDAGGREPVEYDMIYGMLGFSRTETRITLRVQGTVNDYKFDDVRGLNNAIIDQSFRDRTEYVFSTRVGYEFRPGFNTFIQGALNWRDYDNGVRSSDGYRVEGGVAFDMGGVTSGELFAGYRQQSFDNPAFRDADGFSFGANILWNPTALTSVQFRLVNEVNESTTAGASGFVSSGASVQVDHELLRNVVIGGLLGYTENDYVGINRVEKLWNAGLNADYLLNRNFRVGLNYRYDDRDVGVNPVEDYSRNRITLTLRGAL